MNHLKDCFNRWDCASGCREDYLLLCRNGIPLHCVNRLLLQISNSVAYWDPQNVSLAISQGLVYMPHKHSWEKFKVPILFDCCLDDQLRSASFEMQRLILRIVFTRHTSMAYDEGTWTICYWLIKSTWHSLHSPRRPSTSVCQPWKQSSLSSLRGLVPQVEHNVSVIQETLNTWLIIHAHMYFVVSTWIFVLPHRRFNPKRYAISTRQFGEGSTQLVRTQRWRNLTTIGAALIGTSLIRSRRSWSNSPTILFIVSTALLLPLMLARDS